jgi:hypothetical protein
VKRSLKNVIAAVVLASILAMLVAGCGDFRQQALQAQARLDEAVQRAEIAEEAAAQNTGRILELQRRVEVLEAAWDDMKPAIEALNTGD